MTATTPGSFDGLKSHRPAWRFAAGVLVGGCALGLTVAHLHAHGSQSRPVATSSAYGSPELVCDIEDERLNEASGIVCGWRNPDVFYTHNDSGGRPEVYAVDRRGKIRAVFVLAGAANLDWEDISLAPGSEAGKYDIVVGDIGDNSEKRPEVQLYRFAEPGLPERSGDALPVKPQRFRLRYPDGPHNAEALFVHPVSGDAWILSKLKSGRARAYRLRAPWPHESVATLESVGELQMAEGAPPVETMVTAADVSPDGRRLVTRSYLCGWEWELSERSAAFETLFAAAPHRIALGGEQQGEAICYSPRGDALYTISEGSPTAVWRVERRAGETPATSSSAPVGREFP